MLNERHIKILYLVFRVFNYTFVGVIAVLTILFGSETIEIPLYLLGLLAIVFLLQNNRLLINVKDGGKQDE